MDKHDITKIPVLEEKKLVGVVTDNTIAYKLGSWRKREVPASRLHASSVVEKDIETIDPDAQVTSVLFKVGEPGPTILPVLSDDTLVGVVTKADLLPYVESEEQVQTIMKTDVQTISPNDRIIHARRMMVDNNVARLPVVHEGQLMGMISDMEIAVAFARLKKRFSLGRQKHQLEELLVKDYMKTPAVWIPPTIMIRDASKLMVKMNVGALPVLKDDQLIGIISRTDVLKTIPTK
jgi:CBS domain-containing protein